MITVSTDYLMTDDGHPVACWCVNGNAWVAKSEYSRDEAVE